MKFKAWIYPFLLSAVLFQFTPEAIGRDLPVIFEELEVKGPEEKIINELERFIGENPGATALDEALLRLARVYIQKKEYIKAADIYQKLLQDFPQTKFKFDALYELGTVRYNTGRVKEARSLLEPVSAGEDAALELRAKAAKLLKEIDYPVNLGISPSPAIGVLLPLKGGYTEFAEDALNGVLLAAAVFGQKGGGNVEVYVKDVGSDPESVERTVEELSANERVGGLVGPLLSSTALETAKHAQRKKIPVITLSQKDGVTEAGEYVFRNFLTPAAQAQAIAEYAIKLGHKRFAVVYPHNNYGTELARLFEIEVKKRGGEIARKAQYPQGQTDFSDDLKRVFGIQIKETSVGRRKIKEFKPTVRIDAVYIPDSYEAVSLIAPYLDYFNVKGVQLLGSNGWHSDKLAELAGKSVEGAVFVDGFFAGSARAGAAEFTSRFQEAYGKPPGVIEAQAFDAAMILIEAIREEKEGLSRESVKNRLRSLRGFKGATGSLSFDLRGEAVKKLFLLTVKDGRIVEAE
ncbi:MAG: penicillin-binding protein activator [Deltaproteobacteria bacterium]|nr:penicillin-binding protein activator [Deltaproteobacteria bacterium]